ncbi:internal scaffolding protein [Dipodfec virus UOA04_Rod_771]|nr:internal scaffolding protein [Dipodfec virus UOA04_Rod_771]
MVDKNVVGNLETVDTPVVSPLRRSFYNRLNLPPKVKIVSNNPTKVQESPLDARTPQEVLDYHGMYRDPSYYEENPDKMYMDLTQFDDYETYMNNLNAMKDTFSKLPIDIRAKFNHDPSRFFSYVGSKEFDIEQVMDDRTKANYRAIKAKEKAEMDHQAYLESDEYKNYVKKQVALQSYLEQQFELHQASLKKSNTDHT